MANTRPPAELTHEWLHGVALAARTAVCAKWRRNQSCIASARVAIRVLRHFGVVAKPFPVRVGVYSAEFLASGGKAGYSVGVAGTGRVQPLGGWDGHLALRIADRWYCDPSADQLDRPQHNLRVLGPVLGEVIDPTSWKTGLDIRNAETGSLYRCAPMENEGRWRQAPDWKGNVGLVQEATSLAVGALLELAAASESAP